MLICIYKTNAKNIVLTITETICLYRIVTIFAELYSIEIIFWHKITTISLK